MNLSEHFTLEELTASGVALRKGLDNTPDAETIEHLKLLAATLEQLREILGPIHIDSGYRSPEVNFYVGGSSGSAHLQGYAADIIAPGFGSPLAVCKAIQSSGVPFDQVILEGTWAHCSIDPRTRREVLTAHFAGGKVSYTEGLA